MRIIGYLDGKKCFVRDGVSPNDLQAIAAHIAEFANSLKQRLVLFVEHDGVFHMIQPQAHGGW